MGGENVNEAKKAPDTEAKAGLTVKITVDDTQLEIAMEKAKQLYACLKDAEEIIRTLYKGMDQITVYAQYDILGEGAYDADCSIPENRGDHQQAGTYPG